MQQHLPFTVLKLLRDTPSGMPHHKLQQHLPFTVLKQRNAVIVAKAVLELQQHLPFTVLKPILVGPLLDQHRVATALTVYGIETGIYFFLCVRGSGGCNSTYRLRYWNYYWDNFNNTIIIELQQHLPFTVLKRDDFSCLDVNYVTLQQHLPFTVLKLKNILLLIISMNFSCNSTYRLRYWNNLILPVMNTTINYVATALTVYGIETKLQNQENLLIYLVRCNSTYRLRYWNP